MRKIIVIAAALAVGVGAYLSLGVPVGSACDDGLYCSPGWWKNHPEAWENGPCCLGLASDPTSQCGILDEMLRARGPGSADTREDAQAILSACFDSAPCDDD